MNGVFRRMGSGLAFIFRPSLNTGFWPSLMAKWNGTNAASKSAAELKLIEKLRDRIPNAREVDVIDISHGCGDMYEVHVVSSHFKGKSLVQQHRLIQTAIGEDIRNWHGLRISTAS